MDVGGHKRDHQIAVTASSGHLGSGHLGSCQATGQCRVTQDVIQRWPPCLQVKWRSRPTPDLVSQASALIKKDRLAGKSPQTTLQIKANRLVVIGQSV